eukprot:2452181-Amphidinium_carterae.1
MAQMSPGSFLDQDFVGHQWFTNVYGSPEFSGKRDVVPPGYFPGKRRGRPTSGEWACDVGVLEKLEPDRVISYFIGKGYGRAFSAYLAADPDTALVVSHNHSKIEAASCVPGRIIARPGQAVSFDHYSDLRAGHPVPVVEDTSLADLGIISSVVAALCLLCSCNICIGHSHVVEHRVVGSPDPGCARIPRTSVEIQGAVVLSHQ